MKAIQFTVPISEKGTVVVHEDVLPHFYNYFHRHAEAQVSLILKGEGTLIAGNYTQPIKAGDVYIIGPNQPHIFKSPPQYFSNNLEDNVHAIHIFFDFEKTLAGLINLPELDSIKKFLSHTSGGLQLPDGYKRDAAQLIKKVNNLTGLGRLMEFVNLLQFFATEVKDWKLLNTGFSKHSFSDSEGMRMNDIYQYTIEHYTENFSLDKIARIAHITPHAFCKYFKKHTRKTYMSFLNEVRINEACKKIINGDFDSIASVGYATGFNNAITFNRVFKRVTGMSPSEYIRNYRRG